MPFQRVPGDAQHEAGVPGLTFDLHTVSGRSHADAARPVELRHVAAARSSGTYRQNDVQRCQR